LQLCPFCWPRCLRPFSFPLAWVPVFFPYPPTESAKLSNATADRFPFRSQGSTETSPKTPIEGLCPEWKGYPLPQAKFLPLFPNRSERVHPPMALSTYQEGTSLGTSILRLFRRKGTFRIAVWVPPREFLRKANSCRGPSS